MEKGGGGEERRSEKEVLAAGVGWGVGPVTFSVAGGGGRPETSRESLPQRTEHAARKRIRFSTLSQGVEQ